MEKETIAELQARQTKLEQKIAELKARTDETSKLKLDAARKELSEVQTKIELASNEEKLQRMEAIEAQRREQDADAAVHMLIQKKFIQPRETDTIEEWRNTFIKTPELISKMTSLEAGSRLPSVTLLGGNNGNGGRTTKSPTAIQIESRGNEEYSVTGGRSIAGALKKYYELAAENMAVDISGAYKMEGMMRKGELAREMAGIFKADLEPKECICRWEHLPMTRLGEVAGVVGLQARNKGRNGNGALQAADNVDANLGTLSGTLVIQRTLPVFAFSFPELLKVYTDFSDTPGLFNQTEQTRIVTQAPVELYDTALDATGRAKGWDNVVAAVTTDVPLTLNRYIGVPINFNNATLASTTRRLFDEQAELSVKAIAAYFTGMLTDLVTGGNYNSYVGSTVLNVGATYVQTLQNFSMTDLDYIGSAFDLAKVPVEDRSVMLNPSFFGKLRGDQRLWFMYMGSAGTAAQPMGGNSEFLSKRTLPELSGFAPYNAPYLPASNPQVNPTQNNVVGFAFHKAAAILKSRLPTDFTSALGAIPIPGSVTTITDPDTKISIMLVQYVNLQQGYAEWRIEVMLGAAVGDKRAGLVMTSQ